MDSARKEVIVDDPYADWESELMQFRLTYEGPLLSDTTKGEKAAGRAKHKQEIRKVFHEQLKRLWKIHPVLSKNYTGIDVSYFLVTEHDQFSHDPETLGARFERNGYNFVPMVTRGLGVHCALDILFLVDGLKMPRDLSELGEYATPNEDEKPFFCLLEDDSLITRLSVEADTLLQPIGPMPNANDARVVLTVTVRPYVMTPLNHEFG
jgi:hypothetical protein